MIPKITFKTLSLLAGILLVFTACDSEDGVERLFEAGFQTNTIGLSAADESREVVVNFSIPTIIESTVTLDLTEQGVSYGTDYQTSPAAVDGVITLTVPVGAESAQVTVTRLVDFLPAGNSLELSLSSITGEESVEIVGSPALSIKFEEVIADGGVIDLLTGGSNMPNQCYIDLSTFTQTVVRRDTWELAFYSGTENRVFLNAALLVTAAELTEFTDIDAVSSETVFTPPLELTSYGQPVTVSNVTDLTAGLPIGYSMYGSYTDAKDGQLESTAIAEISATDSENKVYLISLGSSIPAEHNTEGGLTTTGESRGIYKIRVLLDGDNYKLQYAALDAKTHQEVTIAKTPTYNHTYFSMTAGSEVAVEPAKENWDINFSGVYSYYGFDFGFGAGLTYSDYALHNTLNGVSLYEVITYTKDEEGSISENDVPSYEAFSLSDVHEENLISDNRAVIGSDWRDSSAGIAKDDRYYVIKDLDGNYFKLQFTQLLSEEGERGYGQFVYAQLK
ncbi:hypothetical protein BFP72_18020 [Reichenbachiella sp. 5M10]|uniref:HmuY family protein n=1 Tax=Reichenbachiella sp. 5M10 TaxID=1889772 RepID=UPI000C155654|nr:HmuY family protein [Reichenbachiella sp. 5M10]PIB37168.1 hypothetical protein BFP72_18020 [Reichenbachiella sp. 5M10]